MLGREKQDYLKGKSKDIHEEDKEYQEKVRQTYLEEGKKEGWMIIKCAEKQNKEWKVRTIEEIHNEIWEKIKPLIK
jgi:thymidylate kinase